MADDSSKSMDFAVDFDKSMDFAADAGKSMDFADDVGKSMDFGDEFAKSMDFVLSSNRDVAQLLLALEQLPAQPLDDQQFLELRKRAQRSRRLLETVQADCRRLLERTRRASGAAPAVAGAPAGAPPVHVHVHLHLGGEGGRGLVR